MRDDQDARIEAAHSAYQDAKGRMSLRAAMGMALAAADAVHEREPGAAGPSREDPAATDLHWAAMAEAEADQFRLRVEAAEAREEALRDERSGLIEDLMRAEEDRDEWARESEALREALERYGVHESGCPMLDRQREDICYCGLDAALARSSTAPQEERGQ